MTKINATASNRKTLRSHAREAMADYSSIMTWLTLDTDGNLREVVEPQGQSIYVGDNEVIATTGSFYKAHGDGAALDNHGEKYTTQRRYLTDLLGADDYARIFSK